MNESAWKVSEDGPGSNGFTLTVEDGKKYVIYPAGRDITDEDREIMRLLQEAPALLKALAGFMYVCNSKEFNDYDSWAATQRLIRGAGDYKGPTFIEPKKLANEALDRLCLGDGSGE